MRKSLKEKEERLWTSCKTVRDVSTEITSDFIGQKQCKDIAVQAITSISQESKCTQVEQANDPIEPCEQIGHEKSTQCETWTDKTTSLKEISIQTEPIQTEISTENPVEKLA